MSQVDERAETAAAARMERLGVVPVASTAGALAALVLLAFQLAVAGQLAKLHPPGQPGAGFGAIETDRVAEAFRTWDAGRVALADFDPAGADTLIRVHVGADLAIVVLGAAVVGGLLRTARWRAFLYSVLGLYVLAAVVRNLCQLALAAGPATDRYVALFDALRWIRLGCVAVLAVGVLAARADGFVRATDAYRRAPATARIAGVAAAAFAITLQAGNIGAQSEDILRREMSLGWWALARILVAVLVYLGVIALVRRLVLRPGDPTAPTRLLQFAAVVVVMGVAVDVAAAQWGGSLVRAGSWSAPLLLAALVAVVGALSTMQPGDGPTPTKRQVARRAFARWMGIVGLVAAAAGLITVASHGRWWSWALLVGGTAFVLVGAWSGARAFRSDGKRWPAPVKEGRGRWLYAFAGAAVPVGLAMLAGRVVAGEVATQGPWAPLTFLAALFVLLGAVAGRLAVDTTTLPQEALPPLPGIGAEPVGPPTAGHVSRVEGFGPGRVIALYALALAGPVVALVGILWPSFTVHVGNVVGSIGILVLTVASVVAISGAIRFLGSDDDEPIAFQAFGFRRTPMVLLLFAWFLLTATVGALGDGGGRSAHAERVLLTRPSASPAPPCSAAHLEELFGPVAREREPVAQELCRWIDARATTSAAGGGTGPVPLVLVSASGGGVRAAAWTARVLDCLFLPDRAAGNADPCGRGGAGSSWPLVFAANGASGGSVGIVSAVGEQLIPLPTDAHYDEWIRRLAQPDHVAPLLTHMVFGETLLAPLGIAPGRDRAGVLIDGWVEPFDERQRAVEEAGDDTPCPALDGVAVDEIGFLQAREACPDDVPLLLLNGSVVADGSRFDISPLRYRSPVAGPGDPTRERRSLDLLEVLCDDEDVPLFDAAFLSSRFPLVTPSAHFPGRTEGGDPVCDGTDHPAVEVVDGGYAENSGSGQLVELWQGIAPLLDAYKERLDAGHRPVQPVLVDIDNGTTGGASSCDLPTTTTTTTTTTTSTATARSTTTDAGAEPAAGSAASEGAGDGDRSIRVGEPLRPLVAKAKVDQHGGAADHSSHCELERALREADVPIHRFALYEHPGRRLPLGWSLSSEVLDDLDAVYCLDQNQRSAAAVRDLLGEPAPDPAACRGAR